MPRRTRRSPLGIQDPKIDFAAAADRGVPPPTTEGGAATTPQAHHLLRSPSFNAPRAQQRNGRCSIPSAAAAAASYARALHQSRATCPAATSTTSSGPPRRAVGGSLNPDAAATTPSSVAAPKITPPSLQLQVHSTPPPARGRTPSPSRGSRSYAEAVKGRAKANQKPYDNLVHRLFDYLIKFAIFSEMIANCGNKRPIITVRETGNSNLWIGEQHLGEYDQELSCAVFSSQHHRFEELLYPAVSQFLISKRIVDNVDRGMNASFYPSTKTLEDFVQEQGSLVSMKSIFDGNFKLCVANNSGMMLFHGFLVYILNIHNQGHTWNGEFSIGDMMVENCLKCSITKVPMQGESHYRVEDLKKLAKIFKPMFTINGERALYFDVLHTDLRKVDIEKVEAKWYREYLLSHPALKSSIARYNLECGLHAALRLSIGRYNLECGLHRSVNTIKSNGKPIPSVLLEGSDWMPIIPLEITKHTPYTYCSLFKVFWHRHDPKKSLHPYAKTVGGLLTYKRNFLQHGHEHINVQDHTELEQFAAKTFHQALPNVLRGILSRCEMNGPFKDHWEAYQSSRVGNDGNTEWRTGIHISFRKMSGPVEKCEGCFGWKDK